MRSMSIVLAMVVVGGFALAQTGCEGENTKTDPSGAQGQPTSQKEKPVTKNPVVIMETSEGTITIELYADKAPATVKNFLRYVDEKFYDQTIFHRVIDGFMIQGGGFTADMQQKEPHAPVKNEATNGLKNLQGAIAMARTGVVDSATAQFFINVADNAALNHRNKTQSGFGYCVFGKVTDGMGIVDAIKAVPTGTVMVAIGGQRHPFQNVPVKPVLIESVRRAE